MSEPTQEEVMSVVSSIFDVSAMGRTLDTLHFKIEDEEFKSKFVDLAQKLERRDLVCKLEELKDGRSKEGKVKFVLTESYLNSIGIH